MTPGRQARGFIADLAATGRARLALLVLLGVAAAVAEGAGLLLLVPLLEMLGLTGAETGPLAVLGGRLGLPGVLAMFVGLLAVSAAIVWARTVAAQSYQLAYADRLKQRLHGALIGIAWPGVAARRQSDFMITISGEASRCAYAADQFLQMTAALLQMPALLLAGLILSPVFTLVTLALCGLVALLLRPLSRQAHSLGAALAEAHRTFHAELTDQVSGLRIIKMTGAEGAKTARFRDLSQQVRSQHLAMVQADATARAVQRIAAAAVAALCVLVGIGPLGLSLAEMLVLLAVFARIVSATLRIQGHWRMILQLLPAHAQVMASLEQWRAEAEPRPAGEAPTLRHRIDLRGVGYRHGRDGTARAALVAVDAVIPALATTAVIGPSGAGKSTLADIVMGLVPPDTGMVMVDTIPLTDGAMVAWRRRVGYVPQDPFLFHTGIRENLLMAAPTATEAELWDALEAAAVAGRVRSLPDGLDTVVGDRGARLSGGERQRIALARALLGRPDLLVLDEATSALDAETERAVAEALDRLKGRTTLLVVAHRPSTVQGADHVLVLDEGRLVAQGSWEILRRNAAPWLARLDMG
ncbi:hypothetical protein CHU95_02185 [Niveispirillum lacus]|uniref:ABC transporter ATP-binding protein n=1 Tax=Niveispirillum lacus TaxID=1981099 RepID=A0A255Z6S6_9PROT|nr:ABC transporter ATP-binding protein [Niveispirillum lacus]OYQ37178.1 hypothetical protein CHU95_02185 [Niveispirillum lacus]